MDKSFLCVNEPIILQFLPNGRKFSGVQDNSIYFLFNSASFRYLVMVYKL